MWQLKTPLPCAPRLATQTPMSGSAREAINEQPGYEWSRHGTKSIQHMENLNSLASQKTMCNERGTCCNDIMKLRCRKIDSMLCSIRKYHLSGTALVHTPFIHVTICPFICSYIHSSTPHIDKYFHLFSFFSDFLACHGHYLIHICRQFQHLTWKRYNLGTMLVVIRGWWSEYLGGPPQRLKT